MPASARTFSVRHVQLGRALFAAAAALMITFSPDHSAAVGLAVFGGFAATTALILVLGAWLVAPAGERWPWVLMAAVGMLVAMAGGVPAWRTDALFFVLVIVWAASTGLVELLTGLHARRRESSSDDTAPRDAITVGALSLLLAVVLLAVPVGYSLDYAIDGAGSFTLTGIILGVGLFGGYAAILAVFLGIAGFTPRRADAGAQGAAAAPASSPKNGGTA